jgi:hypothetical protein
MDHLHWEFDATPRDTLQVTVDRPANVLLLDEANYQKYCTDQAHSCFGGFAETSPVTLKPYRAGHWHVAVDAGRSGGQVKAAVKNVATGKPIGTEQSRVLKGAQPGHLEYRADRQT